MTSSEAKVARGGLFLLLGNSATIPIGILTLAFVARVISLEEMGIVVAFDIIIRFLKTFSDPGISDALTTYCAEGIGGGYNVGPFIRKLLLVGGVIVSAASLGLFFFGRLVSPLVLGKVLSRDLIAVASGDVFLGCLAPYFDGAMLGLKHFKSMSLIEITGYSAKQLASVTLLLAGFGVTGILLGWILGDGLYLVGSVFVILRGPRGAASARTFNVDIKELLRFTGPAYGSRLVTFVSGSFDRLFALAALSADQLAVYGVAASIFGFVSAVPGIASSTLVPYFAESRVKETPDALRARIGAVARYFALFFAPVFTGLAAISGPSILLVAGQKYTGGAVLLAVLCSFYALTAPLSWIDRLYYALKRTDVYVFILILESAAGILLSLVLATQLGILGLALARGLTFLTSLTLGVMGMRKVVSIRLDISSLASILLCSFGMAAFVYSIQRLFYSLEFIPIYVVLGAAIYLLLARLMHLIRKRDFEIGREIAGDRFGHVLDFLEKLAPPSSS
jgi:O-antigen/teichoic acid export membrane protein